MGAIAGRLQYLEPFFISFGIDCGLHLLHGSNQNEKNIKEPKNTKNKTCENQPGSARALSDKQKGTQDVQP